MNRWLLVIGVGLAIIALLAVGFFLGNSLGDQTYQWHSPGSMMWGGYGSMHAFGGGIVAFLFWGLAVIGGVALLAWGLSGRAAKPAEMSDGALETLRRRFARGEIDQDEFERIRESLSK